MENSEIRVRDFINLKSKVNELHKEVTDQIIEIIKDFNVQVYKQFVWTDCSDNFSGILLNDSFLCEEVIKKFIIDEDGKLLFETDKSEPRTIDILDISTVLSILDMFVKIHKYFKE
jgi:hypothetical protein